MDLRGIDQYKDKILAVLQYGSSLDKTSHAYSDTDICIVAPGIDVKAKEQVLRTIARNDGIDVKFFEDLPEVIKYEVIRKNHAHYVKDHAALLEYFLFWQKACGRFMPHHKTAQKTLRERIEQWKSRKR